MPPGKSPRKRAKTRIFSKDFNLFFRLVRLPLYSLAARSPSGKATVCKTVITGSNPVRASKLSLSQLGFTKVAITVRGSGPGPARNGFEPNKTAWPPNDFFGGVRAPPHSDALVFVAGLILIYQPQISLTKRSHATYQFINLLTYASKHLDLPWFTAGR